MKDAFGVERGEISKAEKKATGGRRLTGIMFPGMHGAVAGKKGKKLKAAGNELGGYAAGTAASYGINRAISPAVINAAGKGNSKKAIALGGAAALGGMAAGVGATDYGVRRAQRKGHFKKQPKGSV
jgi:hypothetical protein